VTRKKGRKKSKHFDYDPELFPEIETVETKSHISPGLWLENLHARHMINEDQKRIANLLKERSDSLEQMARLKRRIDAIDKELCSHGLRKRHDSNQARSAADVYITRLSKLPRHKPRRGSPGTGFSKAVLETHKKDPSLSYRDILDAINRNPEYEEMRHKDLLARAKKEYLNEPEVDIEKDLKITHPGYKYKLSDYHEKRSLTNRIGKILNRTRKQS
jgi:hypothetical protein